MEAEEKRQAEIREQALGLLARREHGRFELQRKLGDKGHPACEISAALSHLEAEGLQSDQRFTQAYIHSRAGKGYGPARIAAELRERRIDAEVVQQCMGMTDVDWFDLARQARAKRFGNKAPTAYAERARQQRFLQYRGFAGEHIAAAIRCDGED